MTAKKTTAKKTAAKKTASKEALVHCYRLIFQVDPGGSRKAESFVAGTLAEARKAAKEDLESGTGAYHALFYGEEIYLQCWEGGRCLKTIDLHPYITYEVEGLEEPITMKKGDAALLEFDDHPDLMDAMVEEEIEITVTIAWDAIKLPAMKGRPLREGESVQLEQGRTWAHGFHEHWDDKIDV